MGDFPFCAVEACHHPHVQLVHEAMGLDVNPATAEKFRRSGDMDSVAILEIIHTNETTRATAGHR